MFQFVILALFCVILASVCIKLGYLVLWFDLGLGENTECEIWLYPLTFIHFIFTANHAGQRQPSEPGPEPGLGPEPGTEPEPEPEPGIEPNPEPEPRTEPEPGPEPRFSIFVQAFYQKELCCCSLISGKMEHRLFTERDTETNCLSRQFYPLSQIATQVTMCPNTP